MKQLRLLGLLLMTVFALGFAVVANASAVERGALTLKEEPKVLLTGENLANSVAVTAGPITLTCTKLWVLELALTEPGKAHFTLGKDANLHISGCKSSGTSCNTEGDEKEVVLLLVDSHLVNLLDKVGGKLVPGFFWLLLTPELTPTGVLILCGIVHITIRGAMPGIIEPLNAGKAITLTEEVEKVGVQLKSVVCDKENEKVCDEILEKEPLQCDFGTGFGACTVTSELETLTAKPDVLWDD